MKNALITILVLVSGLAGCGVEWLPGPPANVVITTSALPSGAINTAYSETLSAYGGKPPYTWELASGSTLPSGLTLSSAGVLSGTPTAAGTTTFSVTVTDSSTPVTTATKSFSLLVSSVATTTLAPASTLIIASGQTVIVPSGTTYTAPGSSIQQVITGNIQILSGSVLNAPSTANTAITFTVTGI